ncbi:MAG: c-type cytochrome [Bacteroidia bacterium]
MKLPMRRVLFSAWVSIGLLYSQEGKALFQANCASCHAVNKRVVGPALAGVHQRWQNDEAEMVKFIKNSQAYINGNFKFSSYAKKLYEEYNKTLMTAFTGLSDEEIKGILDYIAQEAQSAAQVAAAPTAATAPTAEVSAAPSPGLSQWILIVLATVLGILAFALVIVSAALSQLLRRKEGGQVEQTISTSEKLQLFWQKNRGRVIGLGVLVGFIFLTNATVKRARSVGLHPGYQPVQPIAFSHKTHAGQYNIACQYCHVGVEKGKSATIPSTNICMNCHNYIQEGSRYGTKEIAKILESYEKNKPIEWVRIHNLPDLVYFNHAQHVKVAGIECQTCHGPIQEMEEVYQYADLSMGWCINCHRESKVDLTKSSYYQRIHAQLGGQEKEVTVEKLGGLECSKCHY